MLVVLLSSNVLAQPQPQTTLHWKWTPGAVTTYRSTQDMDQQIASDGQNRQISLTLAYVVRQTVREVSDKGVATIAQEYESAVIDAKEQPGEQVRYDSKRQADASKRDHRLIKPYAAFVGKTITFEVDPEGKVLRVDGAAGILAEAFDGVSESNPLLAPLTAMYKQTLTDESIRASLERQLRVVPARTVRIGEKWNVQSEQRLPAVGTIRSDIAYMLKSITRNQAALDASGTLTQRTSDDPLAAMLGVTMKQSRMSGSVSFDTDVGQIITSTLESQMVFEFKPAGMDLGEGKVEQRIKQRATLERLSRR